MHTDTPSPRATDDPDIKVRPLVIFIIVAFVLGVVIHLGLIWLFKTFRREIQSEGNIRQVSESVAGDAEFRTRNQTPEPRVQGIPGYHDNTPRQDTVAMNEQTHAHLTSSGLNPDGSRHIPINTAMRLAVQRKLITPKLPTTRPSTQPTTRGAQ